MKKYAAGIYAIYCRDSGRTYIGSTKNLSKRIHDHFKKLKTNQHGNKFMQRDFNKRRQSFKYKIIENCHIENLIEREAYWIDFYKTTDNKIGYNSRIHPQSNTGFIMPQFARDKISSTMKGRKQTDEHRLKQCISRRGRKNDKKIKIKISLSKMNLWTIN